MEDLSQVITRMKQKSEQDPFENPRLDALLLQRALQAIGKPVRLIEGEDLVAAAKRTDFSLRRLILLFEHCQQHGNTIDPFYFRRARKIILSRGKPPRVTAEHNIKRERVESVKG